MEGIRKQVGSETDEAFEALQLEIECFFESAVSKLKLLKIAMETEAKKPTVTQEEEFTAADDAAAVAREPFALQEYWSARAEKQEGAQGGASRRFVGYSGAKKGVEIRLHGRWMELSTQTVGDEDSNIQKSMFLTLTASRKISERINSKLFSSSFHPGSMFRLGWDVFGGFLLLCDAILSPINLAWELDMGSETVLGVLLMISFWTSFIFWSADILVNFNTAVYHHGRLETSKAVIASQYLRSWFVFDVGLVTLDWVVGVQPPTNTGELSSLRSLRVIRALRLLRLLKAGRLRDILQELVASTGRQSILFYCGIFNTAVLISLVCHLLACFWFGIGRASHLRGEESWLQIMLLLEQDGVDEMTQYLHSLRYVIGAPSPPMVAPTNTVEVLSDIAIYGSGLMVLGTAVSKISNTLAELRAMNEEHDRQRREIRMYLTSQSAPFELVSRIMKFVDYRLDKMAIHSFDQTLISKTLQTELYVNQRSPYLVQLPIFALCQAVFTDVFADICAVMQKRVFEKKETVFAHGSWATVMEITASGSYSFIQPGQVPLIVNTTECFQEACLYTEGLTHASTLLCKTFAETLSLAGEDLVLCLRSSPSSCRMFIEYAREFVQHLQKSRQPLNHETQVRAAELATLRNEYYQELYPDPRKMFDNMDTAAAYQDPEQGSDLSGEDLETFQSEVELAAMVEKSGSHRTSRMDANNWLRQQQDTMHLQILEDKLASRPRAKEVATFGLEIFIEELMGSPVDCVDDEFQARLRKCLPELDPKLGPHKVFEQDAERDRAESSCLSVLALLANRYETFTAPQGTNSKLLERQWRDLQGIISWIAPTTEQVHGVLVLLAIRALGKSKTVLRQVPKNARRPERAILYLISSEQHVVPSVRFLSERATSFVQQALEVHEKFNLAQMLQGENVPGSVLILQDVIQDLEEDGEDVFHFYILFLLGFMCGLAGGRGSRFLDSKNAEGVISGIRMLQQLLNGTPRGIYWGFLSARAQALGLPKETAEDLVLVRMACLARVTDDSGYIQLRSSWDALGFRERSILTEHFLADGISDRAFIFEFLPACVNHAQTNPIIGLTLMLEVLVDLLSNLALALPDLAVNPAEKMITVDLSDMSEFVAVVQNRFVFQTCMARSRFNKVGNRLRVEMTGGNWARTSDVDSDMTTLAYGIKDVFMRQQALESLVRQHLHMTALDNYKDYVRREKY